jgi:two-component system, NtrC family, sensor kinase
LTSKSGCETVERVRLGLRLQLLFLLGALLVAAFVPLFFATSTYTQVALERQQRAAALHLGRSLAAVLTTTRGKRDADALLFEASRQVTSGAVQAIAVYDSQGQAIARAGEPELVDLLPHAPAADRRVHTVDTARGPALVVYTPDADGGVATVSRVDPITTTASALTRITALYMGASAIALLVFAYFGLTRWIVRPILSLGEAAQRVAGGARRLEPIVDAPPELVTLSQSLSTMTARLRGEEEALRRKVEEVEEATEDLRTAQASLVRSERLATVGRLAAGLAHEIGNPLSAVVGLCDLALDESSSDAERRDFVARIKREAERIHRVITDLLTYARPGRSSAEVSSGSVADAIAQVRALLAPQKELQALGLSIEVEAGLPPVSLSDGELVQVVLNLVMNAADACDKSGRTMVKAIRGGKGVLLSIEDDGPGVAAEVKDSLFEPFVTTKDIGHGTGLGLSVSRGLVEGAGGTITLDRDYAPGARFVIDLPAVPA